jgi:hypothetical protein
MSSGPCQLHAVAGAVTPQALPYLARPEAARETAYSPYVDRADVQLAVRNLATPFWGGGDTPRGVGTGVDERVSMLVGKLSLRWRRLSRGL